MANSINSDSNPWSVSHRQVLLVGFVVCVLAVNVGTRTFCVKGSHSATVEASSTHGMRQHLQQDAAPWVIPVLNIAILRVYPFHIPAPDHDGFSTVFPAGGPAFVSTKNKTGAPR